MDSQKYLEIVRKIRNFVALGVGGWMVGSMLCVKKFEVRSKCRILFSLKKKGNLPYATTGMNLEDIVANEMSQSQRDQ